MKLSLVLTALISSLTAPFAASAQRPAKIPAQAELSVARLYDSPSLTGTAVRGVSYGPKGALVTYLKARREDQSRYDLWAFDIAAGEARMLVDSMSLEPDGFALSEEEKALRERQRIASQKGIVQYAWDHAGKALLVPLAGDLFLADAETGAVRRLTETEGFEYDAKVSPAGGYVSFLRDGELYAIDLEKGRERRISPAAEGAVSYGTAEFVAQEEMDRLTGNWWSPDDKKIAYTRTDETGVDVIPRFDIAADAISVIEQRYPRAGRPNAVVDLYVKTLDKRRPLKVSWGASPDSYLARVHWAGPEALLIETVNRDQTELTLSRVDLQTGATSALYTEKQPAWINLSKDFRALGDGRFLWTTEESGFRHIHLFTEDGDKTQITVGRWPVLDIEGVDEGKGLVYFTAHKDTPLEKHLYRVSFQSPGEPERITQLGYSWSVKMAPGAKSFVGTRQNVRTPPQTAIHDAGGKRIKFMAKNTLDENHPYAPYLGAHSDPEFGTLKASDGQILHYKIIRPHDFDPSETYPAILSVYGGPGVQRVTNSFGPLSHQMMQQRGYVVMQLDNRGSSGRGKAFEDVIYRNLAKAELDDQVKAAKFLAAQPFVDENRIGVMGWSYGGYMALHLALRAPENLIAASVAGAPVTDWSLYDTFYTERYMDTPEANEEGYKASSALPYLEGLDVPLLLIHGMADDNVVFDNTTRAVAALQKANVPFDLMTYPGQRHSIHAGKIGAHRLSTTMRFLDRNL